MCERIENRRPNNQGKPHRNAKHGGNQLAQPVGVGLTEPLGSGQVPRCGHGRHSDLIFASCSGLSVDV